MRTFSSLLGVCLIAFLGGTAMLRAEDKVIVHEWGTFTCLQDEQGKAIGGINVDDEPVPSFVWQYANSTVAAQYSQESRNFGLPPYNADGGKGWAEGDPTVTMRLETPVIYIYPPKGRSSQLVPPLDVHVDFHGGVLSQYYPYAQINGSALNGDIPYLGEKGITGKMTTGLTWKGVLIGASGKVIPTKDKTLEPTPSWRGEPVVTYDKVWTTPREVSAPLLQVKFSLKEQGVAHDYVETEHFLFYRGVGHLDSPVQVDLDGTGAVNDEHAMLHVHPRNVDTFVGYSEAWLVDIRGDGKCAYVADNFKAGKPYKPHWKPSLVHSMGCDLPFEKDQYSAENLGYLRASMHDALVKEGLYDDEATAMLKTWELSYFKSPGLRFFYIVPRKWVDKVLPLKITGAPTEITRVMVGRIELISAAQKAALARLAAGPCPDLAAVKKAAQDALQNSKPPKDDVEAFYRGEKPLSELGITIPPLVQDYLSLGRFRDALIVHEQQQHPSVALAQFIKDNRLASGN